MRLAELAGKRIAVWGYGREGSALVRLLRTRLPHQPLSVIAPAPELAAPELAADSRIERLALLPDVDVFRRFDVVFKSPGISRYREDIVAARAAGVRFATGTELWFSEHAGAPVIAVTGTKGKSTTSSLVAHLLRATGARVALAGNIGLPLVELLAPDPEPDWWVLELSSYQTAELAGKPGPGIAIVLNLFPEHLDWHGDVERYFEDKLALLRTDPAPAHIILGNQEELLARWPADARTEVVNRETGWHLHEGMIWRAQVPVVAASALPLHGRHNVLNLCAALTAVEAAIGWERLRDLFADGAGAELLGSFHGLPHRLEILGERGGVLFVNDSISTTPYASLAALECFMDRPVCLIVGGYERGLDWSEFAERASAHRALSVIAQGQNGPRIAEHLRSRGYLVGEAVDLVHAVLAARERTPAGGVVLLSPGAPSFPQFHDYTERGQAFALSAGFTDYRVRVIEGTGL